MRHAASATKYTEHPMTFANRVKGVLLLDVKTFEDIEADTTANGQALLRSWPRA